MGWPARGNSSSSFRTAARLTWSTELGAVVVVDRGAGQFPAVFYVSVPASLGTQNVATFLSSLRIS